MNKKNRRDKRVAVLTTLVLLVTMMPITSFAGNDDVTGHWAESVINEWLASGLAGGYPDSTFKPDAPISRAEFITLVNKAFYFTQRKAIDFNDVKTSDWYYDAIATAMSSGYISGYSDKTMAPNQPITRQEAAIVIAKARGLALNTQAVGGFSDSAKVSAWSKSYVGAVATAGYMNGYPDGTFRPSNSVSRSEAVVALNNAMTGAYAVYDKSGTYGPATGTETLDQNVVIKADGVILQNLHITGDLVVTEEVGLGDITLNNLTVDGDTFIRGGGMNSIHINGGKYKSVMVQKTSSGRVRVVATNIDGLKVVISENAASQGIILEGDFESVQVDAPEVTISTQGDTAIGEMKVSTLAGNANISLGENTVVRKMVIAVEMKVTGKGTITSAETSVENITFETAPKEVTKMVNGVPATTTTPTANNGGRNNTTTTTVSVTGITVAPTTLALTVGGSTGTIAATVSPTNATNKSITWSSSDTSVATVSNGVVTPIAVGTANVTATSVANTSSSAICVVTVTAPPTVNATTPSSIVLEVGTNNPVGSVTNVGIPAASGTDTSGAVNNWSYMNADRVKFTVTDASPATSVITINGSDYTSGNDYTIRTTTSSLAVVVITSETDKITTTRTFNIPVTENSVQTTTPSAITLSLGATNPVSGITNVSIPAAWGTDTTGAVTGWEATTASTIKITVIDAGGANSLIQIDGKNYDNGTDYEILSTDVLEVEVVTMKTAQATVVRKFMITVTP